ncbi:MAG: type IX secretion system membrane protein PorP/SprF [Saprospirales bacterium]|nr:MAG: type IX secretion system membrane protein PorP/SprF [Saprospirales bacterium]
MNRRFTLLIATMMTWSCWGIAQEIHWTQYEMQPLLLNPAKTGDFHGTFRVGGIYRNQFSSITPDAFNTPGIFLDAPISKGFRDNDWVGVGGALFVDRAGALGLQTGGFFLSGSYHFAFGRQANTYIVLGLQTGAYAKRIRDIDAYNSEAVILGEDDPVRGQLTDQAQNAQEYAAGLIFKSKISESLRLEVGYSIKHLNRASLSPLGRGFRLPWRHTGHGALDIKINDQITLTPAFMFETFEPATNFVTQLRSSVLVNEEKDIYINGGLGFRWDDSAHILFGLQFDALKVGVSYDLTVSDLATAANYFGGFEIAANYIIKIYKKPEVDPVIFCPRF